MTSSTPRRIFGPPDDDTEHNPAQREGREGRRFLGRTLFAGSISQTQQHRPSFLSRWRNRIGEGREDEENAIVNVVGSPKAERPPIPSALQPAAEVYATPLPALSMIVLSITMLGEFLSANVSAPFLLFMVENFNQFKEEADVGYWTGLLVSTFFLTQFLTSLLWATVAAKHGARTVLFISLMGSAITCFLFGTSTNIQQAMTIRLMQGVFAGAIGVARGAVPHVTDQSNEGRAYAILGFCWGFGGVSGAIIGGTFENPAKKWPNVFDRVPIFIKYPYLLPCTVAASITFIGSILSLFLGPDCGPRYGAIRLPPEKPAHHSITPPEDESRPTTPIPESTEPRRGLLTKLSGYFVRQGHNDAHQDTEETTPPVPLSTPHRNRTFSRTSRADGSAYGYGGSYRSRLASNVSARNRNIRRPSWRRDSSFGRRESNADGILLSSSMATGSDMNFAQRLLMANENAVTNIADLWVASAMNADNEEVFEDDEYEEERLEGGELDESDLLFPSGSRGHPRQPSEVTTTTRRASSPALALPEGHLSQRRFSNAAPSIFSHVGVRTPPAVLEAEAQQLLEFEPSTSPGLERINEGESSANSVMEKEPSLMSQLPILIILQYGFLALHSTTHDQVFYLYLVSKYQSGGLNLNAGHFSQLIALMCLFQIVYQFYFYPNIGPPRGRFSHLSMFRIGCLLFIPAYLTVIMYRVFASDEGEASLILMGALALSTAVRFCGQTFAYTAISVLLNYMSPPHVVGFANGIAQSIVSLARFCGPVIGGLVWSMSVQDNPATGYPIGFLVCAGACALAICHSFFIR
ncbi:major facilitator superfamily domain-containing protein [Abortiporus biennis]|nr:major facilitator superfamily domain-containing protein [Abortiporus biennis]